MKRDKQISLAIDEITHCNLGGALEIVKNHPFKELLASSQEQFEWIEEDYQRMLSFMLKGFDDPKRGELYDLLLCRLWQLLSDMDMANRKVSVGSYARAAERSRHQNTSPDFIKSVLESYVADAALLSLDETESADNGNELFLRHHQFMSRLFHHIWTSMQWKEADGEFYTQLLLSPAIDVNDALLIVGAIFLGMSECFDMMKFRTLADVFRRSDNNQVKHTALTSMMLSLPVDHYPFTHLSDLMNVLAADEGFRDEVATLQIQVINCMNAENDRRVIERDIMPTFVKNSKANFGNLGLIDDDSSSVEDIIHPEQQEKLMEEIDEKALQMMKMQKEGADIYFGGFAQSKHSPFFSEMVNWWMPFFFEHPGISQNVRKAVRDSRFLRFIIQNGPFCHSDKYSLAVMGEHVMGHLPKEIDKLDTDEAFFNAELRHGEEDNAPLTIRRYYLQNLYRFYKLYSYRSDFRDPFATIFLSDKVFSGELWDQAKLRVGRKLMKQKKWVLLSSLLHSCTHIGGEASYMLGCYNMYYTKDYSFAVKQFQKALEEIPANERIVSLRARAAFLSGDYEGAEQTYLMLYERNGAKSSYCLNACVAMMHQYKYEESLKLLYQLDYQYEGNSDIRRNIAWCQLMAGNVEKAKDVFAGLVQDAKDETADILIGLGYCHWFLHNTESAVAIFRQFVERSNISVDDLADRFFEDELLLNSHMVSSCDIYMMVDLCRS